MAYDTVVDGNKLAAAMTATADAIRAKTGKSASIAWNTSTGFANAVNQIDGLLEPILEYKFEMDEDFPSEMKFHGYEIIPMGFSRKISPMLKDHINKIDLSPSPNCYMIESDAFSEFSACLELRLPEGLRDIAGNAFYRFELLSSLVLPRSLAIYNNGAFTSMNALRTVEMHCERLMGNEMFRYCDSIESIWISDSCLGIGGRPFVGLRPNVTIYLQHPQLPSGFEPGWNQTMGGEATVLYGQQRPW